MRGLIYCYVLQMKRCVKNVGGCTRMTMRLNRRAGLDVIGNVEDGSTTGVPGLQENPEAAPNLYAGTVISVKT